MKVLKKIVIGKRFSADEMNALRGGSNSNEADYCNCSGSINSSELCKNNSNKATGCTCIGNNSNTNYYTSCICS